MPQPDAQPPVSPRPLVLIVDDMSIIREPIALCLRNAGYDTAEAADGSEALKRIQSRPPNLLVLDIHLGKGDGLTLLNQIRAMPKLSDLPVILLTVEANAQFVLRASKMGVRDYVLKSRFSLNELLTRVKKCLNTAPVGAAPPAIQVKAPPAASREQTIERAEHALEGRTLSGAVAQVISMAASPATSVGELGPVIARDAMLSANVLRVANSAAYSSAKAVITNIPDAIRQIGCASVGRIAASVAVLDCLPEATGGGFNPIRAWQHSFAVAQLCLRLSPTTDTTGGVAYLIGLCHDLTEILFHTHFAAESQHIAQTIQQTGKPRADVERAILGMTQAQLVPIVLNKIGLPQTIREPIVEFHQAANRAEIPPGSTACRLWMADFYANGLLLASSPTSLVSPLTKEACKRAGAEPLPPIPDAAKLRAEVFGLTAMLARLSPKQDASLSEPIWARTEKRIWLALDAAFSPFDPLAAALDSLGHVHVSERLPSASERDGLDRIVAATNLPIGCKGMSAADIRVAAGCATPLLWLSGNTPAADENGPTPLPISLAELERFVCDAETIAARSAA
jgi:CheY-like chemotaxis protein/HD-like signal output (HDOD) protein